MRSQKVMTYDQWTALYKRALKRTIKQKFEKAILYIFATVIFLLPFWMCLDWLLRGY